MRASQWQTERRRTRRIDGGGAPPTDVIPTGELVIGEVNAPVGVHKLEVEIVGKNGNSTGTQFRIDWFEFR